MKYIFLIVLLCITTLGFTQTRTIDSIRKDITKATIPEKKIKLLFALCEQKNSLHPDTLFSYANEAKRIAFTEKSQQDNLLADYYVASALEKKSALDSALSLVANNLKLIKNDPNTELYRKYYYLQGTLLLRSNKFKEAQSVFYRLLENAEKYSDTLHQIAAKGAIGWVYMEMRQPTQALNWFRNAIQVSRSGKYEKYFSPIYANMAAEFGAMEQYDSVEYYLDKASNIAKQQEILVFLANTLNLRASLYMFTNKWAQAEAPLKEAVAIREKIGDPFYIVSDLEQLSLYYSESMQLPKAIDYINQAISIVDQYHLTSKKEYLYSSLAQIYRKAGNLQKYSATLERIISLKDSIYEINSAEALAGLQAKYELQKKENLIISQNLELVKRNYLLYGAIIFTVLLLALAILFFKNYQKRSQLKLQKMRDEEKLAAAFAVKGAEENERKRIAADLHDNLGAYAASIVSNIDNFYYYVKKDLKDIGPLRELRKNSLAMVSELSDTIWVLKKEALSLTAISDRLKVFIQRLQPSYPEINIDVNEMISLDHSLPPSHAFHLFHIIQEAINNAIRHSHSDRIDIHLYGDEYGWSISVADNGEGYSNHNNYGNGINNMKERSKINGWLISWMANPPKGTKVIVKSTTN